jgi:hypothetical protein
VVAINLLQSIYPHLKVTLLQVPSIEWKTEFLDKARQSYHEQKMASKDARPKLQMDELHNRIPDGKVHHLKLRAV